MRISFIVLEPFLTQVWEKSPLSCLLFLKNQSSLWSTRRKGAWCPLWGPIMQEENNRAVYLQTEVRGLLVGIHGRQGYIKPWNSSMGVTQGFGGRNTVLKKRCRKTPKKQKNWQYWSGVMNLNMVGRRVWDLGIWPVLEEHGSVD